MNVRRGLLAMVAVPVFTLSAGAGLAQGMAPDSGAGDKDSREAVVVTPAERAYILNQMRLFVASIQTIAAGLGADDRAQAGEAAAARGLRRNANDPDFPPTLGAKLPQQWKQLGGGMRKGFDVLAEIINAGGGPRKSLEQLGVVMTNCVACHATYRVTISRD
jgi:hypothetical protein